MSRTEILLETEQFEDFGGWVLESQFVDEMGSELAEILRHERALASESPCLMVSLS
ncbi:MAG: hypothetical protein ACOYJL_07465 [Tractidigestivibacter sp.]|jgi:hypothetical protein